MTSPAIFLDANVLKFAATRQLGSYRYKSSVRWGSQIVTSEATRYVEHNPQATLNDRQWNETIQLPVLAHLAERKRIRLLVHHEVWMEFLSLPKSRDIRGPFFGAPLEWIQGPARLPEIAAASCAAAGVRIILGEDPEATKNRAAALRRRVSRETAITFFQAISHPRYRELKRAVGATTPTAGNYLNQLRDAFHIWCAETAGAEYFCTQDIQLIKHLKNHKATAPLCVVTTPSALVKQLIRTRVIRFRDAARFPEYLWGIRRSRHDPDSSLIDFGKWAERIHRRSR